jgi:hypothetical protein
MDTLRHLIEDSPTCPACCFCDERIDGPMELYGGTPMHPECYDKLGAEMNSLDDPPQDTISEDELEYAYQSHYGFGHAK